MTIKAFGDCALLIELEQKIDIAIHEKIIYLNNAIKLGRISGIMYTIPAYCSLTIGYDPMKITFSKLKERILEIAQKGAETNVDYEYKKWKIPVCYEAAFAPDLSELSKQTQLSKEEIIQLHATTNFRVFMLGFIPGFAYMGKLPEALFCHRRESPRKKVAACSVGLAGHQTGIYPSEAPGGWQIIGRTPIKPFDGHRERPFLFKAGDEVNFFSISSKDYQSIQLEVESGRFKEENYCE